MFHYEIFIHDRVRQADAKTHGYSYFGPSVFLAALPSLVDDAPMDLYASTSFVGYMKDSLKPLFLSPKQTKAFEASDAVLNMGLSYTISYDIELGVTGLASSKIAR